MVNTIATNSHLPTTSFRAGGGINGYLFFALELQLLHVLFASLIHVDQVCFVFVRQILLLFGLIGHELLQFVLVLERLLHLLLRHGLFEAEHFLILFVLQLLELCLALERIRIGGRIVFLMYFIGKLGGLLLLIERKLSFLVLVPGYNWINQSRGMLLRIVIVKVLVVLYLHCCSRSSRIDFLLRLVSSRLCFLANCLDCFLCVYFCFSNSASSFSFSR